MIWTISGFVYGLIELFDYNQSTWKWHEFIPCTKDGVFGMFHFAENSDSKVMVF